MIGAYWAQPEGQRLTFRHTTREPIGEACFRKNNTVGSGMKDTDRKEKEMTIIRNALESGEKTRAELAKLCGMTTDRFAATMLIPMASFAPDIYEEQVAVNGKITVYYGLVDKYPVDCTI